MSSDGIVLAVLALAVVGALIWFGLRKRPAPLTPKQSRDAIWADTVAQHLVDTTAKTGRKPWE